MEDENICKAVYHDYNDPVIERKGEQRINIATHIVNDVCMSMGVCVCV